MSDKLIKALDYLKKNGLHKGSLYGPAGSACALGACALVGASYQETSFLDKVVQEQYPNVPHTKIHRPIALLNDDPKTTVDDLDPIFYKAQLLYNESEQDRALGL